MSNNALELKTQQEGILRYEKNWYYREIRLSVYLNIVLLMFIV